MKNYNKILEAINRGIRFALDDFDDQDNIQGQTNSKVKYHGGTKEWLDLMSDVVDLGLPSGTLWCKYNLGVNSNQLSKAKNWYGDYYAWGELEGNKTNKDGNIYFDWNNYKFTKDSISTLTKYCNNPKYGLNGFTDNLTKLQHEDDVAYQNKKFYNFEFHIPTKEQLEELLRFTQNYWVNDYNPNNIEHHTNDDGINGLNGRVFIGQNGNQLFIPAAGHPCDLGVNDDGEYVWMPFIHVGSACELWTSSLYLNDFPVQAYYLNFGSIQIEVGAGDRYKGFNIRPVINL